MSETLMQASNSLYHLLHSGAPAEELRDFLSSLQPADVAEIAERLSDEERSIVFAAIDPEFAARVLPSMELDTQKDLILSLPDSVSGPIVEDMSSDDLADLLGDMQQPEAENVLSLIPDEADEIRQLLQYPDNTAGGLMTSDFIAVPDQSTVEETLTHLRALKPDSETAYYVYVIDEQGVLVGVASLRQLVISPPETVMADIISGEAVTVPVDMDQEDVARRFERYGFLALPVVDNTGFPLGIVTVDDVIDVLREETEEDIALMSGVEPLDRTYLSSRVSSLVRKRIGWLIVLFAAQSVTGNIIAYFEETLAVVTLLTIFIPLLIDSGGNAGAQASTTVVRAMAMGEVSYKDVFRVVGRETIVGFILGLILAVIAFFWSHIFGGGFSIALIVAITLFVIIVLASSVGSVLPIAAQRLGFDPAVAATPLITTVVDSAGLLIYFIVAAKILGL